MVNIAVSASHKLLRYSRLTTGARLLAVSALRCKENVRDGKHNNEKQREKSHVLNCFVQFNSFLLSLRSLLLRFVKSVYRTMFYPKGDFSQ